MEIKYMTEQIQSILNLIDDLNVRTVDSCSKVLQIVQILNNPVKNSEIKEEEI